MKDKEIHDIHKENGLDTESLEKASRELKDLTIKMNKEMKDLENKQRKEQKKVNIQPLPDHKFECSKCDVKTESMSRLKGHVRMSHMSSFGSQTGQADLQEKSVQCILFKDLDTKAVQTEENETKEEFKKYPCNYCNINIANEYHLFEHKVKCRGTLNMFTEPGLPVTQPFGYSSLTLHGFSSGFCWPTGVFGCGRKHR